MLAQKWAANPSSPTPARRSTASCCIWGSATSTAATPLSGGFRGVAQFGSTPALRAGGRRFELAEDSAEMVSQTPCRALAARAAGL